MFIPEGDRCMPCKCDTKSHTLMPAHTNTSHSQRRLRRRSSFFESFCIRMTSTRTCRAGLSISFCQN